MYSNERSRNIHLSDENTLDEALDRVVSGRICIKSGCSKPATSNSNYCIKCLVKIQGGIPPITREEKDFPQ